MNVNQLAAQAGLDRNHFGAGEWARITNALYAVDSDAYNRGYAAALRPKEASRADLA